MFTTTPVPLIIVPSIFKHHAKSSITLRLDNYTHFFPFQFPRNDDGFLRILRYFLRPFVGNRIMRPRAKVANVKLMRSVQWISIFHCPFRPGAICWRGSVGEASGISFDHFRALQGQDHVILEADLREAEALPLNSVECVISRVVECT